jgi:hypothetical protein
VGHPSDDAKKLYFGRAGIKAREMTGEEAKNAEASVLLAKSAGQEEIDFNLAIGSDMIWISPELDMRCWRHPEGKPMWDCFRQKRVSLGEGGVFAECEDVREVEAFDWPDPKHLLSYSCGVALAGKLKKAPFRVYCLLGDGELQEGQVWEAAMDARQRKLDNLCAIVDWNGLQENGPTAEIKNEEPIMDKWKAFGWNVVECDGHDFDGLFKAFGRAEQMKGLPTVIKANTVKGKGVSFMEGQAKWHGKAPKKEELDKALAELGFGREPAAVGR